MATKSGNKGRYICKVGFYDIYAKDSFKPKKTSKYNYAKADVASTEYNLVHAKKVVEKGFKTKGKSHEYTKNGGYCCQKQRRRE
jgi:hypothetical protein